MNKQKGFALIEIIIVIAIIAILAGIIISRKVENGQKPITQYSQDAKEVSAKAALESLRSALSIKLAEAGTIAGVCLSSPDYPNYSFLKNLNSSLKEAGYSFVCEEISTNNNCYKYEIGSESKWYAVACDSDNACFCADSSGGALTSGSYTQFLGSDGSGPKICACQ